MLNEFLDFLFGTDTGLVYVPTKKKSGEWQEIYYRWPLQKQQVARYIQSSSKYADVYICPSLLKARSPKKESFQSSRVVWVDLDGNYNGNFKGLPEPSAIIQSSVGNNAHVYWKLDEVVTSPDELEALNRRIAVHLEADISGFDCTQVLRPPGTINYKRDLPVSAVKLGEHTSPKEEFDFLQAIQLSPIETTGIEFQDAEKLLKV